MAKNDEKQDASYAFLDLRTHQKLSADAPGDSPVSVGGEPASYRWKELIRIGNFIHPNTGHKIDVDRDRLLHWCATGNDMIAAGVRIPINEDHDLLAKSGVGEVKQFKIQGDGLSARLQVIGADASLMLARNDVSVGIAPKYGDGTGKIWKDVIYHVAITQLPVVTDLNQAIAASRESAAGSTDVYLSADIQHATPLSQGVPMDGCNMSADQVKALKGIPHLCMSSVPESAMPDGMVNWHKKADANMGIIRRDVPGMDECQPGDELSRMAQHATTMKRMSDMVMPRSAHMSMTPTEYDAALLAHVEDLSKGGKHLEGKDQLIREQQQQITLLSAQVVKPVDPDALSYLQESLDSKKRELIARGFKPHAAKQLLERAISADGKINAVLCSKTANPFGKRPFILDILDILAEGMGGPVTATDGTTLSRQVPTDENSRVSKEETEKMMKKMMEMAAA